MFNPSLHMFVEKYQLGQQLGAGSESALEVGLIVTSNILAFFPI